MFDLFISYSRSAYTQEAVTLQQNLEKKGLKIFLDKQEIDPGSNFPDHIAQALMNSKLVIIYADESYFSKTWCVYEYRVCIAPYDSSIKKSLADDTLLENIVIALPDKGNLNIITAALPPALKSINWPLVTNSSEVEKSVMNHLQAYKSTLAQKLRECNEETVIALRNGALLPFLPKPLITRSYTPIAPASVKEKFKGRSEKLWEIYNSLEVKNKDEAFHSCVIEGVAGMGKTQLAAEYMWRFSPYTYPDGYVWVSADTDEKGLLLQFTHIYEAFSGEENKNFTSIQEAANALEVLFKKAGTTKKILWVIDNFPEPGKLAEIKSLTAYCPVKDFVSLLVTTRQHGVSGADKLITLNALTSESAIEYLTQSPVEINWLAHEDWYRIVNWVGNLPLALRILYIDLADGFINAKVLLSKAISSESSAVINEEANALKEEMPPGYIKSLHDALGVSYERLTMDEELFSAAHLFSRLAARPVMESLLLPFISTKQLAKLAKRGWLQPVQETNKLQRCWTMHKVIGSFLRNKSMEPVAENVALLNWLEKFFEEHAHEYIKDVEPHFRMITVRALEAWRSSKDDMLGMRLEQTSLKAATADFQGSTITRGIKFLAADILHAMGSADVLVYACEKQVESAEEPVVTTMIHALSACSTSVAAFSFVLNRLPDKRDQVRWMALLYLPRFKFADICTVMIDALMYETNEQILTNNEMSFPDLLAVDNEAVLESFITKTLTYYNQTAYPPHHKLIVSTWCELVNIKHKTFKAGPYTYDQVYDLLWQAAETNPDEKVRKKAINTLAFKDDGSIYKALVEAMNKETEPAIFERKSRLLVDYITALEKPGAPQVSMKEDEGVHYLSGFAGASGKRRPDLFAPLAQFLFQPAPSSLQQVALRELLDNASGRLALANLVNEKIDAKSAQGQCIEIADMVIDIAPDFSSPYWWKARVLIEKQEFETAYINLSQVITLSPSFADAYLFRGKLSEEFNNPEAAALDLDNYNKLNK